MGENTRTSIYLALLAALLYVPFIGKLHLFDWDEINFAESAREMLHTGNYLTVQIFYEPFWEKPPLFIWFQALCMKILGVNELAARLPNAIAGIITLVLLFNYGNKLINRKFGIIWSLAYGSALLPFLYFKSGIIDPWFNLFIFIGIIHYVFAQQAGNNARKLKHIAIAAVSVGLSVLTKGPVGLGVFGLTAIVLLILERFKIHLKFSHILLFAIVFILTGGSWFIIQIATGNWQTVVDFVVYQIRLFSIEDSGHGGFPLYHFVVLLVGVFPVSLFAILGHQKQHTYKREVNYFRNAMLASFWIVLILFSIVKTKIVHYSSFCYFPMSFLAAYVIYALMEEKRNIPRWLSVFQIILASLFGLAVIIAPIFDANKDWIIKKFNITHPFTVGNLQGNPHWSYWIAIFGIVLIIGTILGFRKIRQGNHLSGFRLQWLSTLVFIYGTILFIVPGAEKYSQNAAIEFFKSMKDKDVYVQTTYKSYAKLFYAGLEQFPESHPFMKQWRQVKAETKIIDVKERQFTNWLAKGNIDKTAYFVIRSDKKETTLNRYKNLSVVYEKNGYVFCKREPEPNSLNK